MRKPARLQDSLVVLLLMSILAVLPACGQGRAAPEAVATKLASQGRTVHGATGQDNVVLQWNNAVVESIPQSGLGGTAMARAFAIVNPCIYDAWAAYDATALGTRLGASLRRPASQRSLANQEKAIS